MATIKLSDYGIGENFNNVLTSTDKQRKALHAVSLTEWGTTTKPEIEAGSVFNNNGALYEAQTNQAISGSPTGKTWIIFDESALTYSFTNTTPTWAADKQGWYGTGGTANDRYLLFVMTVAGASYASKAMFTNQSTDAMNLNGNIAIDGDIDLTPASPGDRTIDFASDASLLFDESESGFQFESSIGLNSFEGSMYASNGRRMVHIANFTAGQTQNTVFDVLSPFLQLSTTIIATGTYSTNAIKTLEFVSPTRIAVTYGLTSTALFDDGDATAIGQAMAIAF